MRNEECGYCGAVLDTQHDCIVSLKERLDFLQTMVEKQADSIDRLKEKVFPRSFLPR